MEMSPRRCSRVRAQTLAARAVLRRRALLHAKGAVLDVAGVRWVQLGLRALLT